MNGYVRRIIDDQLDDFQPYLAATSLFGVKGVGKTATAEQRSATALYLDTGTDRERLRADPGLLQRSEKPLLIDEWQRMPQSWDLIRRAVDRGADKGSFILTGSASVPRDVPIHSGAARMVGFRMRPLSLAERQLVSPTVSLSSLLAGDAAIDGESDLELPDYVDEITRSGFPDFRTDPPRVRAQRIRAYLEYMVQREFPEQGQPVRRPEVLMAWLTAYAAATASPTSYNKIMEASTAGLSLKPSKTTTTAYRDALAGLWILDPIASWAPTLNRIERLTGAPKHYLADPALACWLLNVDSKALLAGSEGKSGKNLREGTLLGALFEHLVAMSVQTYAQANDCKTFHLRTQGATHEVDLIIESPDGRVVGIEVKLAHDIDTDDTSGLHWLKAKLKDDLIDMVIVNTGRHAYRRSDGVAVVPAALLTA